MGAKWHHFIFIGGVKEIFFIIKKSTDMVLDDVDWFSFAAVALENTGTLHCPY